MMRITDVVYAFPALLLAIIMQISFGDTQFGQLLNGLVLLFVSLSIVNWTGVARLVRGTTISLTEKEFVEAARASGASHSSDSQQAHFPEHAQLDHRGGGVRHSERNHRGSGAELSWCRSGAERESGYPVSRPAGAR